MTPPDPSVLAKGLLSLTSRFIDESPDASFRTSMLRTTLRLDGRPSLEQVQSYQRHLQAELEALLVSSPSGSGATAMAKIKAVDGPLQPKAKDAGAKPPGTQELCRYFAKASGCRRGDRCTYSHSMVGMDKEQRAKKCLRCGAEGHRQKECTVGKPPHKGTGGSPTATSKDFRPPRKPGSDAPSLQSTVAPSSSSTTSSTVNSEPAQGTAWTLEALVQAAQQMVQNQAGDPSGDSSPEKTKPEVKVIRLRDVRVCSMRSSATALVDSGATHSLRTARDLDEWSSAEEVMVQLAGSHQLPMRMTKSGTLLIAPPK